MNWSQGYGDGKIGLLLDCLCLLVSSGQVAPAIAAESVDRAPAQRFNRMIVILRAPGAITAPWQLPLCDRV